MQASALTMGELGKTKKVKTKKVKAPKLKVKGPSGPSASLNLPSQAWVPNSYDPPPPVKKTFSLAPPSGASVIDVAHVQGTRDPQQPGQGKFSQITQLINKGFDAYLATKQPGGGGDYYTAPGAPDPGQVDPGVGNAASEIGAGLGGAVDSVGKAIQKNPLLFGGLLLGGVLLFASPPKRGR
jgi:hypothetical protein